MSHSLDDARWAAVAARDGSLRGRFVYAVSSTGIYCAPGCASRRPRRAHVAFFDGAGAAERAGYRACLRCRPGDVDEGDRLGPVARACRLLAREEGPVSSAEVARAVGLSPAYFVRAFKAQVGVTPQAYRRRLLAERAKRALAGARAVSEAAYAGGYGSSSRFYARVGGELGMAPREARRGGRGQEVTFALRATSLGPLCVAWTARGLCDVRFADGEGEARAGLEARYPEARLARGEVPAWVDALVDAVERPRAIALPLDVQGTAFQERVWQALRRIPPGETRTYREVARAIGAPSAHRAVARACATNNVAVAIPCHRVVRSDGERSGYRWGVARKQALLEREAEALVKPRRQG